MLGPAAPGGPGGVRAPLSRSLGRLECLCSRCFAIDGPIAHDGPRPRYLLWLDGGPSGRCLPGLGRAMSGLGLRMLTDETADGRNSRLASKAFDFQDAHTLDFIRGSDVAGVRRRARGAQGRRGRRRAHLAPVGKGMLRTATLAPGAPSMATSRRAYSRGDAGPRCRVEIDFCIGKDALRKAHVASARRRCCRPGTFIPMCRRSPRRAAGTASLRRWVRASQDTFLLRAKGWGWVRLGC